MKPWKTGFWLWKKKPDDAGKINEVFRAAHTMKGNAATVGLDRLVEFAHIQENALDMIRKGKLSLTAEVTSLLLTSVDALRGIVKASLSGEALDENTLRDLERRIKNLESGPAPAVAAPRTPVQQITPDQSRGAVRSVGNRIALETSAPHLPPALFEIDRGILDEILISDMHLFVLWVRDAEAPPEQGGMPKFLNKISSYGQALEIGHAGGCHLVLLSSVLEEAEMVALAAELVEDQVFHFNQEALQRVLKETKPAPPPAVSPEVRAGGLEERLEKEKKPVEGHAPLPGPTPETIRVGVDLIDRLMNLAGELVLGRNQLRRYLSEEAETIKGLAAVLQHLNQVTTDIQEHTMQMRMQPVGNVLNKLPRVVRDMSRQLGKEVELIIEGAEVELDKTIVQAISSPLTALIGNSLEHGLETPAERLAAQKPRLGKILIKAFHEEGLVNISIRDDGRGVDPDQAAKKALSLGLIDEHRAAVMSEKEKINLILLPGYSGFQTGRRDSSGAAGLEAVRWSIEQVGGNLEIDSVPGKGASIRVRLPLTLAIIPSLIVKVGGRFFAIPQRDVLEMVSLRSRNSGQRIETIGGSTVMRRRDRLLPLAGLDSILGLRPESRKAADISSCPAWSREAFVIVIRMGANRFGLVVDELLDTEEIVVKPLSRHIKDCRVFSGAAILGDGAVAMILNAAGLAEEAGFSFSEVEAENKRRQARDSQKQIVDPAKAIVVFNNAPGEYFALPLAGISRLEMVAADSIQKIGRREYVKYDGGSLPLIRIENHLPVSPFRQADDHFFLIIPRTNGPAAGIVASKIVDAYNVDVEIKPTRPETPGLLGRGMVDGRLTMFLDAEKLLAAGG
ncbi:MAG: chemotaxis protein CheA [Pseudomonadota bacterium]